MLLDIENLRKDYRADSLDKSDVNPDPFLQFRKWFQEAMDARLPEPNAMTLATCTPDGYPSARIVLLKGFTPEGFEFYTNYDSRKGGQLRANPRAALVFLWLELQRQVRIEGRVERLAPVKSTEYFQSRPKGSQVGAWASPQSRVISAREVLEQEVERLEKQYAAVEKLPRPDNWGGYLVIPHRFEFWQGRSNRLHDRIQYRRMETEAWELERLAP